MAETADLTRQLLTAACWLTDRPGTTDTQVLQDVSGEAADAPVRADVFQRVALAAAMSLDLASQHSGIPRDELLAEVLRAVADEDDPA